MLDRRLACGVVAAVVATSAMTVIAQSRADLSDSGSLAALVAEVRQLRLAVEESTRRQTETQALGVYLSAQQTRLVQMAARADTARSDLDAAMLRSGEIEGNLAEIADALQRVTDPGERRRLEEVSRDLKREQDRVLVRQQQAQNRDSEVSQLLQVEDARWTELISRLEQLMKR